MRKNKDVDDIGDKKVLVQVSGGAGSTLALYRCLQHYGRDRVVGIFADTNMESPDLYDLLEAIEESFGIELVRLNDGRNIWDVFNQYRVISMKNSGGACKASVELKIKAIANYVKENYLPEEAVLAPGLDWMEEKRQIRFSNRWKPYDCIFPLNWPKRLGRCEIITKLNDLGLPVPEAYEHGFQHNNCGGCCVLAGIGQWAAVYRIHPKRFKYHERKEKEWQENTGSNFCILRDYRGGESNPYPLRVLRKDIEDGRKTPDSWKSMCACFMPDLDDGKTVFDLEDETGCDA